MTRRGILTGDNGTSPGGSEPQDGENRDEIQQIPPFSLLAPVESSAAAANHQQSATVRRFERALAKVQPLLAGYGYGAAFAALMAEGMGIPTPVPTSTIQTAAFSSLTAAGRWRTQ